MLENLSLKDWQKPFQIFPKEQSELIKSSPESELILEIGPGNGKFILWMAQNNPQKTFVAIELRNLRFQNVVEKTKELNLNNLISVHGDARYCLPALFEKQSLSEIYILFPDPWFKRRHHKHRLINTERAKFLHSLLKPKGKIYMATDYTPYAEPIKQVFNTALWKTQAGQSLFPTYFETKWKRMGREIHYFCFVKNEV